MAQLDHLGDLSRLDPKQMFKHIVELPDQIETAATDFRGVSIPTHYVQARNIVILGMGGSAIGGELAAALASHHATVPIEVRRDYQLPHYVSKDSLVIGVSYSGNTEETLDGFLAAAGRGAKLVAITTGGELGALARKFQAPLFSIDYGAEPRAAFGYLFTAVLMLLAKLRHLTIGNQLEETAVLMRALAGKLAPDVPLADNLAKTLATKLREKIPLIIGAGVMAVVAKRWKTQMNENGKLVAVAEGMPELCHNVIVGMERVYVRQRDSFSVFFLQSNFSHPRNQLRMSIIARQFAEQKMPVENLIIHPSGTALSEALQMVLLGDYVSLYVGLQAGADPTEIKPIKKLKEELAKHS